MRTKIVYVLVSQETDYYYEMLLLSLYSLRLYHPKDDAEVEVVMDEDTYKRLVDNKAEILNDVTPIVVPIPPVYTIMQRSRYLKTQLRQLVRCDFLYIDTDTIVSGSLESIDDYAKRVETIWFVLDNHHGKVNNWQLNRLPQALNWQYLKNTKHFNGGVMYVREHPHAYEFFELWHKNWLKSSSYGCNYDQVSLRKTVFESIIEVGELNGIWNCQIALASSSNYRSNARIVHYQGATYSFRLTVCSEDTFKRIKHKGKITDDIAWAINRFNPPAHELSISINQSEYDFLLSPMLAVYQNYPRFFRFLLFVSNIYGFIITKLYHIKESLCKR